jgi:hypothetical protein
VAVDLVRRHTKETPTSCSKLPGTRKNGNILNVVKKTKKLIIKMYEKIKKQTYL